MVKCQYCVPWRRRRVQLDTRPARGLIREGTPDSSGRALQPCSALPHECGVPVAAHQIGLDEINTAINNWNINLPTGTLYGKSTAYNVVANGQLMKAWQYRDRKSTSELQSLRHLV